MTKKIIYFYKFFPLKSEIFFQIFIINMEPMVIWNWRGGGIDRGLSGKGNVKGIRIG